MRKVIFIVLQFLLSALFARAYVDLQVDPQRGYSSDWFSFEYSIIKQFNLFGNNDSGRYYIWTDDDHERVSNPYFGWCRNGTSVRHDGVDISFAPYPDTAWTRPIFAHYAGVVTDIQYNRGRYGNIVMIFYPEIGKTFMYAHLNNITVSVGDWVGPGNTIAYGGTSGRDLEENDYFAQDNPHVHIEVYDDSITYDDRDDSNRENPFSTLFGGTLDSAVLEITCPGSYGNYPINISSHNFQPSVDSCGLTLDSLIDTTRVQIFSETMECEYCVADISVWGNIPIPKGDWILYYFTLGLNRALGLPDPSRPQPEVGIEGENSASFQVCNRYLRGVLLSSNIACDMSYALGCNYEETIPPCDCARSIVNRFYFGKQYMGVKSIRLWTAFPQTYSANGAIYGTPGIC